MPGHTVSGFERRSFLGKVAAGILGTGAVTIGRGVSAVSAWTGAQTNSALNQARPDSSPLKIKRVTPYIMQLHRDSLTEQRNTHYVLCRIDTEEGITGWGDGSSFGNVAPIYTEIERAAQYLVGQSAWDIESIWQSIWQRRGSSHGASVQSCIAAIDCALWDIVGQKLNVPVYRLLGGKLRDKVKIYTSYRWGNIEPTREAYARRTRELVAEGALAGKWRPFRTSGQEPGLQVSQRTLREGVEVVRGVREGGPDFDICVEAGAAFNVASAITIAKLLEPFNVLFYEESIQGGNALALREVQRATSVALAAGERIQSRLELREFVELDAFRIVQLDAARCGGITEFRKMAAMAESHFMTVAPHNPNSPVCTAAHLHLSAAMSNFLILEEGARNPKIYRELFGSWEDSPASWTVPEKPGLGVTLSEAVIRDYGIPFDKSH